MAIVHRSGLIWLANGVALLSVFLFCLMGLPAAAATSSVPTVTPNDPFWSQEWYLRQIHMPEAWAMTTGTRPVIVAVIDTGVDITHPDLKENIWTNPKEIPGDGIDNDHDGYVDDVHGWNFVNGSPDVRPQRAADESIEAWSHGTLVASLIGARGQDGIGMAGVNWNVKIMPLVVLDTNGNGDLRALLDAIRYAVNHGASIINLSLSGFDYDEQLDALLRHAAQGNVLIVSATGNDTDTKEGLNINETPVYPACMDGTINAVLGVSGTDTLDQKAPYANYGQSCTDLAAPAMDIFGARPLATLDADDRPEHIGYIDGMTGTSLAAPLVTGVASLIKSVEPTWTAQQIFQRLLATADPVDDGSSPDKHGRLGAGRVNAARALAGLIPDQALVVRSTATRPKAPTAKVAKKPVPKKKKR